MQDQAEETEDWEEQETGVKNVNELGSEGPEKMQGNLDVVH